MTPKPKEVDVESENMRTHVINEHNRGAQILIIEIGDIELEKDDLERISDIVLADEKTWEIWTLSQSDIIDVMMRNKMNFPNVDYEEVAKAFKKQVQNLLSEGGLDWETMLKKSIRESLDQ